MVTKDADAGFNELDDVEDEEVTQVSTQEPIPTLDQVMQRHVLYVLDRVGGNKSMAARVLDIDRRTMYRYIKKMSTA